MGTTPAKASGEDLIRRGRVVAYLGGLIAVAGVTVLGVRTGLDDGVDISGL